MVDMAEGVYSAAEFANEFLSVSVVFEVLVDVDAEEFDGFFVL